MGSCISYDVDAASLHQKKIAEAAQALPAGHTGGKIYAKRTIEHPDFVNVSYDQALELLKERAQGEVLIRPSSKGPEHLTVSWKVHAAFFCLCLCKI
jgi:hypothetical protein